MKIVYYIVSKVENISTECIADLSLLPNILWCGSRSRFPKACSSTSSSRSQEVRYLSAFSQRFQTDFKTKTINMPVMGKNISFWLHFLLLRPVWCPFASLWFSGYWDRDLTKNSKKMPSLEITYFLIILSHWKTLVFLFRVMKFEYFFSGLVTADQNFSYIRITQISSYLIYSIETWLRLRLYSCFS